MDSKIAETILKRRPSKQIAGYITEKLFIDFYVQPSNYSYSKGWWSAVAKNKGSSERPLFIIVKNDLTELDNKVIKKLENKGFHYIQIIESDDEWSIIDSGQEYYWRDYIDIAGLKPSSSRNAGKNDDNSADSELNHCIEYYKNNNMLIDIAKSIVIEDNFINRYYTTTNIDLIINGKDDEPVCLEIKFKNEFLLNNNGIMEPVFGTDVFQYNNVFMPFLESGISVFNIILYNDVKSKHNKNSTVIFDYLQKKGNDPNQYIWLFKEIHKDETFATFSFTATNTSWSNNNGRTVFCIPKKSYEMFSPVSN